MYLEKLPVGESAAIAGVHLANVDFCLYLLKQQHHLILNVPEQ